MKPVPFHYRAKLGTAKDQWTPIPDRGESAEELHHIARSLNSIDNASSAAHGAEAGARTALEPFKTQPCKIGRTRLFPEKGPGAQDPGLLALCLLLESDGSTTNAP